ncbi:MAG: PAS domain S-box protein, partial [Bradyrhizobium sp.]
MLAPDFPQMTLQLGASRCPAKPSCPSPGGMSSNSFQKQIAGLNTLPDQLQAESAVKDPESMDAKLLRAAVENAADGVILVDATECIRLINPACERLFGYRAAEMIGQNIAMLMPVRDHFGRDRSPDNFISIGIGRRKDGSTFPI